MIAVLIGDITSIGVTEPYRMLTTRSEHRLLQRFDNADERLTPKAIELGLVGKEQQDVFRKRKEAKYRGMKALESKSMSLASWSTLLPHKNISPSNPANKTGADLIATHSQIGV